MRSQQEYVGIFNDMYGGMTHIGNIIRDAWAFGLLPENETCEGWTGDRIQVIYDRVAAEWAKYKYSASNLPPEIAERHHRIHAEALARARASGWNSDLDDED